MSCQLNISSPEMNSWAQKPLYSYHTMTDVTTAEWRKKFLTPSHFYPVSSCFLILRVSQVVLPIQAIPTHSFPQICDPNRALEQFYFIFLSPETATSTLLKHRIKNNCKREKNTMQFICIYPIHMTTYLLCLIDSRGKKKRSGGEIWREDGAQWDRGEQKAPQTQATQVRFCGTTGRGKGETRGQILVVLHIKLSQGWYFVLPVSGCNPRTPESRLGFEQGTGLC